MSRDDLRWHGPLIGFVAMIVALAILAITT